MKTMQFFIILILFLVTCFLFPSFMDAVEAVDGSEPLRPLIVNMPLLFLGAEIMFMVYTVIGD